jgi:16S rRNA (cytosine967-C5)-methyltransferase
MLRAALAALAPGGRLVYSTCSLEPEENDDAVDAALNANAASADHSRLRRLTRDELASSLAPHLLDPASAHALIDSSGAYRTFPPEHLIDGFFAVALEKIP